MKSSASQRIESLFSPDHTVFNLQNPRTLRTIQQTQAQILTNAHTYTHIIPQRPEPNFSTRSRILSPWNQFIRSSSKAIPGPELLSSYRAMLRDNIPPDGSTFTLLLRSCVVLPEAGKVIHCQILKMGFAYDLFLQTGLLDFYSKSGCLSSAQQMFVEMPERDVVAYNAMVAALGSNGRTSDARKLFDEMPEKTSASWNSMITCYCRQNDVSSAREIFDRSPAKNVVSWNAMIDGYCKVGWMGMARELFDQMGCMKDSVTWNTMIAGYLHRREFGTVISMFQRMRAETVKPTEVTMASLLSACAHLGALNIGRWAHAYIRSHYLKIDVVLGNALIDMYFKCGSVDSAVQIFCGMPAKNIFCWNSMITGLGMHGYGEWAIKVFHEMDTRPDGITFVGLLAGCSHSGFIHEGKKYFSQMPKVYGIEPKVEHYGCMVDLLGRAGFIEEAFHIVETMHIQPNAVVWGGLLHACRIHMDTIVSEEVSKHLIELDPNDGGHYVFLSNIYASTNRWENVEHCRRTMIERRVHKVHGCSSLKVNNMVHEFVVGDTSHPNSSLWLEILHTPNSSRLMHSQLRLTGSGESLGIYREDCVS